MTVARYRSYKEMSSNGQAFSAGTPGLKFKKKVYTRLESPTF